MRHASFNVSGCRHRALEGLMVVQSLMSGAIGIVRLQPEPSNQYDKNAVAVLIDIADRRYHIGYVPKLEQGQAKSQFVTQLITNGLVNSVELESYGRLKQDPSIPRFRVRVSHYPLIPGKRDSKAMAEGYTTRISDARNEDELRKVGENIAACNRIRNEDRALLRRLYAERLVTVRKGNAA